MEEGGEVILKNVIIVALNPNFDYLNYGNLIFSNSLNNSNTLNVKFKPIYFKNKYLLDFKKVNLLIREILENDFNVVHFINFNIWNPYLIKKIKSKKRTIKIIQSLHDPFPHSDYNLFYHFVISKWNRIVCNLSDYIIVHSKKYVKKVAKFYSIDIDKISYVPLYHFSSQKFFPPSFEGKVLFYGRMKKYKGIEFIPEIAKNLDEFCSKYKLIMAGYGKIPNRIYRILEKKTNIEFLNKKISKSEEKKLFYESDVVILPYIDATQSGVIPLSFSYGRPVVIFDVGALKEQVLENYNALVVKPYDLKSFSMSICKLLNNKEILINYCKNAWKTSLVNNPEVMANEFFKIYLNM